MSEADAGDAGWAVFTKKKKRRKKVPKKPEPEKDGSPEEAPNQEPPVPEPGTTVEDPGQASPPVVAQPRRPPMKHSDRTIPSNLKAKLEKAALAASSPVKTSQPQTSSKATSSAANGKSKVVPTNGAKKKSSPTAVKLPAVEEDGWTTKVTRKNRRRQRKALEAQADEVAELASPDVEDDDQSNETPSQNAGEKEAGGVSAPVEATGASVPDNTEKNKSKKKKKRKKKAADSSQINNKADLISKIREIFSQHGSNGQLNQNELCNHLSDLTKCSWKQEYKTKYGPMSKFLESNGFSVDNSSGQPVVTLTTQPPPKEDPSPSPLPKKEAPPSQPSAPPNPASNKAKPKNSQTSQPQQGGREKSTNSKAKRKGAKKRRSAPNKASSPSQGKPTGSWTNTVGIVVLGCASLAALVIGSTKMGM